jgi:hypothetical protein
MEYIVSGEEIQEDKKKESVDKKVRVCGGFITF